MTDRPILFMGWRIWRSTECRILEILGKDELSAAQIMKRGRFWLPLYPALVRLEWRGDLSSRWVEGPYPRRRVYRAQGAEALASADPPIRDGVRPPPDTPSHSNRSFA